MRYRFSEEQEMLAETMRRLIARSIPQDSVRAFTREAKINPHWTRELAEAGLFGVCCAEQFGGLELGAVDALALVIEAGKRTLPYPLAETIVAANYFGSAGDERAASIVLGETLPAIAWNGAVSLRPSDNGFVADGALGIVAWAGSCDLLLVPVADRDAMVVIDPKASGVTVAQAVSYDKTATVARVTLSHCKLEKADVIEHSPAAARKLATVLAAGDLLGVARAAFDLTVGYVKEREQFGQPVGRYQAIKHILADDALKLESTEVAVLYAGWALDASHDDKDVALHVAKAYASDAAHQVVEDAVQCHGGIGFTWEYGLHFSMRRIARMARTLGTARAHRAAVADHMMEKAEKHARTTA